MIFFHIYRRDVFLSQDFEKLRLVSIHHSLLSKDPVNPMFGSSRVRTSTILHPARFAQRGTDVNLLESIMLLPGQVPASEDHLPLSSPPVQPRLSWTGAASLAASRSSSVLSLTRSASAPFREISIASDSSFSVFEQELPLGDEDFPSHPQHHGAYDLMDDPMRTGVLGEIVDDWTVVSAVRPLFDGGLSWWELPENIVDTPTNGGRGGEMALIMPPPVVVHQVWRPPARRGFASTSEAYRPLTRRRPRRYAGVVDLDLIMLQDDLEEWELASTSCGSSCAADGDEEESVWSWADEDADGGGYYENTGAGSEFVVGGVEGARRGGGNLVVGGVEGARAGRGGGNLEPGVEGARAGRGGGNLGPGVVDQEILGVGAPSEVRNDEDVATSWCAVGGQERRVGAPSEDYSY